MEFEAKILRVVIGDSKGKRQIVFDKPICSVTYGSSSKCDIQVSGVGVPSCAKLIEKKDDLIILYVNELISGQFIIIDEYYSVDELSKTGLLLEKRGKKILPLLKDFGGDLKVGDVRVGFIFENPRYAPFEKMPKPQTGLFSVSRLKAIGGTYFKILLASFIFHFTLILLIVFVPRPIIEKSLGPLYRAAKVELGLAPKQIEKSVQAEIAPKTEDSQTKSLLASIDSKKELKGFVRNLFYSKADTFDVSQISTSVPSSSGSGGLFTRIDTKKDVIKREEIKNVGPLFASVKGSESITKADSMDFIESELITETPQIEGTLNRDTIASIVRTGEGSLRFCYEEALIRKPQTQGRIVVTFKVTAEGIIENVQIESSTVNDRAFEQCVLSKVSAWRFPKPEEGKATIKYPFVFYTSKSG